jgi:K(+)-stimulated pyrophosphate-energized sodium pump
MNQEDGWTICPPQSRRASSSPASDRIVVGVVAVVALAALAIGFVLLREVLAAGQGTAKMQEIGRAVQEGAAAYLNRQFRTLGIFVVVVFVLLFALPADDIGERIGRSIFFVIGAVFSATIGYVGMWLATRANIRVAAAAREEGGREKATRIAFRTGGAVGMFTVGLGLFGASVVVLVYAGQAPRVLEGFGFGAALLAMFMRVGAASSPRPPTWARTSSGRSSRASRRTTRATPPPSRTTSATTSATARAWPRTCSSPTP